MTKLDTALTTAVACYLRISKRIGPETIVSIECRDHRHTRKPIALDEGHAQPFTADPKIFGRAAMAIREAITRRTTLKMRRVIRQDPARFHDGEIQAALLDTLHRGAKCRRRSPV